MFAGKTVIITGASSGLGIAIALEFARLKANLVLTGRNEERLKATEKQCLELGVTPYLVLADITKPADCENLINQTLEHFGALDYLVLNAGVSMWTKFDTVKDLSLFAKLMDANYLSAVYCTHYALGPLIKSKGMIVAVSSIQGIIGVPLHTGYVASKHALQGFFDALRTEISESGVDILLVLPHWLRGTNLRKHAFGADGQKLGQASAGHNRESISSEDCAGKIIKAMTKRKRTLIVPAKLKLLPWLKLIAPQFLDSIVSRKVNHQK